MSFLPCSPAAGKDTSIFGTWCFNKCESTDIAAWNRRTLQLVIRDQGDAVTIVHDWRSPGRGSWADSVTVFPGGLSSVRLVESAIWPPENWFMGVLAKVGSEKTTKAMWLGRDRKLVIETELIVDVSQGKTTISTACEYALGLVGDVLILTERRSSRPTPVILVFDRVGAGQGE